ncbi:hypothetical protein [Desulfogranum japonicum]|uniref:hypothetical protein n=1 Tax=Desulfogranum japonicum TaxID=231447 RepID=UPI00040B8744|nr:hypothetical protein [Desulfogranum japonicum]
MYLARHASPEGVQYILRESFARGDLYLSRDLVPLGTDPALYIRYTSEVSYEIDSLLLQRLKQKGISAEQADVEELFYPFIDPYVKYKTEPFRNRYKYRNWKPMSSESKARVYQQTHIFDRRRLHFLRFGHSSPRLIDRSPSLYRALLYKSRDEIEQLIQEKEQDLRPRELHNYLFAIFDLQNCFSRQWHRDMVHTLQQSQLDEAFLNQFCKQDQETAFWKGFQRSDHTPEYLLKYLIWYFDILAEGSFVFSQGPQARSFRGQFRQAPKAQSMSMDVALSTLGLTRKELAQMDKKALTTLYRKKAHSAHPDTGGDHDSFIALTSAYQELLRTRL